MSGGGDREAIPALVDREQARWSNAVETGRAAALPGVDLLRVRTTRALIEE